MTPTFTLSAIDWSSSKKNCSYLALGTKSGSISIWKFDEEPKHICKFEVSSNWIVSIAWSSWNSSNSILCVSDDSGHVFVFRVNYIPDGSLIASQISEIKSEDDAGYVTCMRFVDTGADDNFLFVGKGSRLYRISEMSADKPNILFIDLPSGVPISGKFLSLIFDI